MMKGNLTATSFLMICAFVSLVSVGQIFIKKSVSGLSLVGKSHLHTLKNIFGLCANKNAIVGSSFYVVGTFIWLLVLGKVRLSVAYPMMSLSYFLVVFLSVVILKEKVDKKFAAIGLLLIAAGVAFVGLGMGRQAM